MSDDLTPDDTFDELEPTAGDEPVLDGLLTGDVVAAPSEKERSGLAALGPTPEEIASFQEFTGRIGEATKQALTPPPGFVDGITAPFKSVKERLTKAGDRPATRLPETDLPAGTFAVHLSAEVRAVLEPVAEYRRISMERLLQSLAEDEAYRLS